MYFTNLSLCCEATGKAQVSESENFHNLNGNDRLQFLAQKNKSHRLNEQYTIQYIILYYIISLQNIYIYISQEHYRGEIMIDI